MTNKNQSVVESSREENSAMNKDISEEKKYFAPLIIDNKPILPRDAKPTDVRVWYLGGKKQKVLLVPASKEVCKEYVNAIERDKKRLQRQMKKSENGKEWEAPPLGLIKEAYGVESMDAATEMELVLLREMFEQLVCIIEKKNPLYGPILRLTGEGKTQREIAKILGKSPSTINEQQQAALKLLRKLYQEEK